ncbi:MAG: hypothetical protein K2X35_19545 [Bryobacteraceae bacterium]|nr:hypothetical protein [Bryobacteraceae bacterium]
MSLIMVRTACCETYKCRGSRCSNCPELPENRQAVEEFERRMAELGGGRSDAAGLPARRETGPAATPGLATTA